MIADYFGTSALSEIHPALLFIIIVWIVLWKGLALWKAAHKESPIWFVIILVINTLGILEILYLFLFSEWNTKSKRARPIKKKVVRKKKKRK